MPFSAIDRPIILWEQDTTNTKTEPVFLQNIYFPTEHIGDQQPPCQKLAAAPSVWLGEPFTNLYSTFHKVNLFKISSLISSQTSLKFGMILMLVGFK